MKFERLKVSETEDIKIFPFGFQDIAVFKQLIGQSYSSITMMNEEAPSEFTEMNIKLRENTVLKDVFCSICNENTQCDQPYIRLLGIRDNEEVHCYEVHRKISEKSHVHSLTIANRGDRQDLRWPFFAHALSDSEIVINYMHDDYRHISIYHRLEFEN